LHAPSILFLDEPTIGLDAVSKLALRDFIKTLNREQKVTVILATHDMHDIEALAERVVIIAHGRILRDGPIEAMRQETVGERRLIIDFTDDVVEKVAVPDGAVVLSRERRRLKLSFDPRVTPVHTLIGHMAALQSIQDLAIEEPTIEELIARFYTSHGAAEA
jgi:ABC-2 type transport system ATP-binding protein